MLVIGPVLECSRHTLASHVADMCSEDLTRYYIKSSSVATSPGLSKKYLSPSTYATKVLAGNSLWHNDCCSSVR